MKILHLDVHNVRGLLDFSLELQGKSAVISGPNGAGKSALVDALDFLFTGSISRLQGEGAAELSVQRHGPHLGKDAAEARVLAKVELDSGKTYTLSRTLNRPRALTCQPSPDSVMREVLEALERGRHVLARREMLKYITAAASTRAQLVQALLGLEDIEELRKLLVGAANEAERNHSSAVSEHQASLSDVSTVLQLQAFSWSACLQRINELRGTLGAPPLVSEKDLGDPKAGVTPPSTASPPVPSAAHVQRDALAVTLGEEEGRRFTADCARLGVLLTQAAEPSLARAIQQQALIEEGLRALQGSECPLCLTPWDPQRLRDRLLERQRQALEAVRIREELATVAGTLSQRLIARIAALDRLLPSAAALGAQSANESLTRWRAKLMDWSKRLADLGGLSAEALSTFLPDATGGREEQTALEQLRNAASAAAPKPSAQTSWDTLTQAEVALRNIKRRRQQLKSAEVAWNRCKVLLRPFEAARERVLGGMYTEIESTFVAHYRTLHSPEESSFSAALRPDGAGLNMEVDFHGKGRFPPAALHSEGHQDSMGLCLYLALAEKLTGERIGVTVLDDVVMSVDADHRRAICELLTRRFPNRQFFITTHDRMWARQLKNAGVAPAKNCVVFRDWSVETGPKWRDDDGWAEILARSHEGNIPAAAAALRRELEQMFEELCESLAADLAYRGDGKYDFGDVSQAAISRFGELLRRARATAQEWKHEGMLKDIEGRVTAFDAAKKAALIDQWIINESVHFNKMTQSTSGDFEPIVAAYGKLRECFRCSVCSSLLYVSPRKNPESLRCACGNVTLNLKRKDK